jgi:hypothetical protein
VPWPHQEKKTDFTKIIGNTAVLPEKKDKAPLFNDAIWAFMGVRNAG